MNSTPSIDSNVIVNSCSNFSYIYNSKGNYPNMFLVSNLCSGNNNYMQWKFSIQLALGPKKNLVSLTEPRSNQNMMVLSLMNRLVTIVWPDHGCWMWFLKRSLEPSYSLQLLKNFDLNWKRNLGKIMVYWSINYGEKLLQ